MKTVVLGAAGFIGSSVCSALLAQSEEVIGIDNFMPGLYDPEVKAQRIINLSKSPHFEFHESDLRSFDFNHFFDNNEVRVIVNEAAMPGLKLSWSSWDAYVSCNVTLLENLLEALTHRPALHLVHASTSSVYGLEALGSEEQYPRPVSPYGVTKLAAENLIYAYQQNFGLSATILRYFSVYGPGQRNDMAFSRIGQRLLLNQPITIYGDGLQSRTNTFISDTVEATILASNTQPQGIFNVCGDDEVTLLEAIRIMADVIGIRPRLRFESTQHGDQRKTHGDSSKARSVLGWSPKVGITAGLTAQMQALIDTSSGR